MAQRITGDMIKPFNGEGDVVAWLKKVTLVARLQKVKDLASLIPLYLEGSALALFLELSPAEQEDAIIIQSKLQEAFSDDPFTAFRKLSVLKWTGESVDVFATELRRLAGLAKMTGEGLEQLVKLSFINAFPDNIGIALQQLPNVLKLEMSDILDRARILTAKQGREQYSANISAVSVSKETDRKSNTSSNGQFKGQCFRCGGPHMIRHCKETKVRCFRCNEVGHVASKCPENNSGNE